MLWTPSPPYYRPLTAWDSWLKVHMQHLRKDRMLQQPNQPLSDPALDVRQLSHNLSSDRTVFVVCNVVQHNRAIIILLALEQRLVRQLQQVEPDVELFERREIVVPHRDFAGFEERRRNV